jgi:hypothetical protein
LRDTRPRAALGKNRRYSIDAVSSLDNCAPRVTSLNQTTFQRSYLACRRSSVEGIIEEKIASARRAEKFFRK